MCSAANNFDGAPMTDEATSRRSANATRHRILAAAAMRFSQHSYDDTTLRDIAGDVGVDVALVHRAFGSKEELFKQAVRATLDGDFHKATQAEEPVLALAALFVRARCLPATERIDPLNLFVRSLNSVRASPILRELVQHDFIEPLALQSEPNGELGAAMAMGCVAGIALLRDVLGVASLRDASSQDMEKMVARLIQACLEPAAAPDDHQTLPSMAAMAARSRPKGQS
ncbi:MAG: TetR family transcriptional regulator [Stappia sp.]|nr:TetR family transcriptional regulator [Stappia sp.]